MGEHSNDWERPLWSSLGAKEKLEKLFNVSGFVKLRVCVGRKEPWRRGFGAGVGEVLTLFGGECESMAWS